MMRSHIPVRWIIAVALFPATVSAQTSGLSFGKDIAPILYAKCVMCHRPGEVAPMSLRSYEEVRPWARAMKSKVISRQMPPWHAEGEPGRWQNDRRLTQAEIDKIVAWADAGAPRGNPGDVPALPQFAQGWNHPSGRPPDVIIEAPEMHVPADGESPWLLTHAKWPFQGDLWVGAMQVVPGNRAVVHHVVVSPVQLSPDVQLDAEGLIVGSPSPQTARGNGGGGTSNVPRTDSGGLSATWEPGVDTAVVLPPGAAARVSGTHLRFNLHYQANGHATTDKTRIGLWLAKGPITHEVKGLTLGGGEVFIVEGKEFTGRYTAQVTEDVPPPDTLTVPNIPAFAENYRLTVILPNPQEVTVYTIQPHMHLRGKSLKYTAVFPDGREEVLINVPKYDFNWQIIYEFAQPITLPAGSAVRIDATWDNSAKNKYNPRPDQEVLWGEQSWDEMLSPIIRTAVRLKSPVTPVPPVTESR